MRKNVIKNLHFWWHALPIAGLIIWGILGITSNLWYDEAYSAALITHSFKEMVQITAVDAHSPFYYGMLKIFYHLLGGGTHFWSIKVFSVLMMFGYMLLGKYYIKKLFDEKIAVYFMLFSLLMPIMSIQAANVRMYATALFFYTLLSLSAYDIYQKATMKKWIVFCLASVAAVYCHTFSMLLSVFLYLALFLGIWHKKELLKWRGLFVSGLVTACAYLPWLAVTYRQMGTRVEQGSQEGIPTIYSLIDYAMEWFSSFETPIVPVVYGGMGLTVFLGYYAVDWMRKNKNYVLGAGFFVMGITVLTGVFVSIYLAPVFMGRYVFPGFGALALLYALGFVQIPSGKMKAGVILVMTACFLLQYRSEVSLEYDKGLLEYQEFVEENIKSEDAIMGVGIHSIMLSVYYPEYQYFLYGPVPEFSPFPNLSSFTQWEQLEEVTGNIWYVTIENDPPNRMQERYGYEEALRLHYMYYDFVIYRLIPNN